MEWKVGGCHCGAVRFKVRSDFTSAIQCNCSICNMTGFLHCIVTKDNFELIQGKDNLTNYQFNKKLAQHFFCKTCGIKSFYVPRSHPDGFSVNLRCLDDIDLTKVSLTPFEGKNWESAFDKLDRI